MSIARHRLQGFTLIELVTVMILVGIMAVYAAPRLGEMTESTGPGYAADVRGALAHARRTAIAARRHVCVDVTSDSISLTMDPALPDTIVTPACNAANIVSLPGGESGKLKAPNQITASSTASTFSFSPKGEASADVTINTGGETIQIIATTGAIE